VEGEDDCLIVMFIRVSVDVTISGGRAIASKEVFSWFVLGRVDYVVASVSFVD